MNSDAKKHNEIIIYSTLFCPYCHAAKQLLKSKDLDFQEIRVDQDRHQRGTTDLSPLVQRTQPQKPILRLDGGARSAWHDPQGACRFANPDR